jgi:cyanophycinase-like exopeptidase
MPHSSMLMRNQVAELQAANKAATRRKSHKRKCVLREGTLTVEESQRLTALREFGSRSDGKMAKQRVRAGEGEPSQRRCGRCNGIGHNARTCEEVAEVASE